jgi:hypothetical protein
MVIIPPIVQAFIALIPKLLVMASTCAFAYEALDPHFYGHLGIAKIFICRAFGLLAGVKLFTKMNSGHTQVLTNGSHAHGTVKWSVKMRYSLLVVSLCLFVFGFCVHMVTFDGNNYDYPNANTDKEHLFRRLSVVDNIYNRDSPTSEPSLPEDNLLQPTFLPTLAPVFTLTLTPSPVASQVPTVAQTSVNYPIHSGKGGTKSGPLSNPEKAVNAYTIFNLYFLFFCLGLAEAVIDCVCYMISKFDVEEYKQTMALATHRYSSRHSQPRTPSRFTFPGVDDDDDDGEDASNLRKLWRCVCGCCCRYFTQKSEMAKSIYSLAYSMLSACAFALCGSVVSYLFVGTADLEARRQLLVYCTASLGAVVSVLFCIFLDKSPTLLLGKCWNKLKVRYCGRSEAHTSGVNASDSTSINMTTPTRLASRVSNWNSGSNINTEITDSALRNMYLSNYYGSADAHNQSHMSGTYGANSAGSQQRYSYEGIYDTQYAEEDDDDDDDDEYYYSDSEDEGLEHLATDTIGQGLNGLICMCVSGALMVVILYAPMNILPSTVALSRSNVPTYDSAFSPAPTTETTGPAVYANSNSGFMFSQVTTLASSLASTFVATNGRILKVFDPISKPSSPTPVPVTHIPTTVPTYKPTRIPTFVPTHKPSQVPTCVPTIIPTGKPSHIPSAIPSTPPTHMPTPTPTKLILDPQTIHRNLLDSYVLILFWLCMLLGRLLAKASKYQLMTQISNYLHTSACTPPVNDQSSSQVRTFNHNTGVTSIYMTIACMVGMIACFFVMSNTCDLVVWTGLGVYGVCYGYIYDNCCLDAHVSPSQNGSSPNSLDRQSPGMYLNPQTTRLLTARSLQAKLQNHAIRKKQLEQLRLLTISAYVGTTLWPVLSAFIDIQTQLGSAAAKEYSQSHNVFYSHTHEFLNTHIYSLVGVLTGTLFFANMFTMLFLRLKSICSPSVLLNTAAIEFRNIRESNLSVDLSSTSVDNPEDGDGNTLSNWAQSLLTSAQGSANKSARDVLTDIYTDSLPTDALTRAYSDIRGQTPRDDLGFLGQLNDREVAPTDRRGLQAHINGSPLRPQPITTPFANGSAVNAANPNNNVRFADTSSRRLRDTGQSQQGHQKQNQNPPAPIGRLISAPSEDSLCFETMDLNAYSDEDEVGSADSDYDRVLEQRQGR